MRDVIAFNLGQDGVKRSSKESAFYPNVPDCRVTKVRRQYRRHNMLIICTALLFGGFLLALLILGQHLLLHDRLVATALVKNGGIKLGHLCGGERQGKNELAVVHRTSLWERP
jgi:hypothetical protein